MPAIFCGLSPAMFGCKPLKIVQGLKTSQISKLSRNRRGRKGPRRHISSQTACNFILMMELRRKIMTFRDIVDLPSCSSSVSTDKLLLRTIKDLHKFYPESLPHFHGSELKGLALDKLLIYFCKALQGLGETSKMDDDKYDIYENENYKNVDKIVEIAVAKLNGLIKIAREKFDIAGEDDENKDLSPKPNTFGKVLKDSYSDNSSGCPSPVTPTSVLPELMNGSPKSPNSSSLLLSLRVQSVGKLNPIDVKRLTLHMLPSMGLHLPSCLSQKKILSEERKEEAKSNSSVKKASIVDETRDSTSQNETSEDPLSKADNASGDRTTDGSNAASPKLSPDVAPTPPSSPSLTQPPKVSGNMEVAAEKSPSLPATAAEVSSPCPELSTDMETEIELLSSPLTPSAKNLSPSAQSQPTKLSTDMEIDIRTPPPTPPTPPTSLAFLLQNVVSGEPPLPPPPPLPTRLQPNVEAAKSALVATAPQLPSPLSTQLTNAGAPHPPPPPDPLKSNVVATGAPHPHPPPVPLQSNVMATGPPLQPPPNISGSPSGTPPPPTSVAKGASPPPPPLAAAKSLSSRKSHTKLKRSSHMGNLYRILKHKVEGRPVQGKSCNVKRSGAGTSSSGKQGMADALAEMTKRSAYFQQIQGDVQKYAKSIIELKTAITAFNTKDMTELLKFYKQLESFLEKLTDETQVLSRFEGFPTKKLEAIRTASALYSKLDSMLSELQNWKTEPSLHKHLDKAERYFSKIKGEVDALERTKDEEYKTFKNFNIDFDFQILVRIKEAMVDVSSNCMELAIKERRAQKLAETQGSKPKGEAQKECHKMLWRAFQFAFRVYTFAGGHDDRAEKLTRELAHEIETFQQH
ncbi:hypothetical protein DITRI_Ditri02bG0028200 [Diplodiscus trichospermus]